MKQTYFASIGFDLIAKRLHKSDFSEEIKIVVPWTACLSFLRLRAELEVRLSRNHITSDPFHAAMVVF